MAKEKNMDENQQGAAESRAQENVEAGASHVRHAADDVRHAADDLKAAASAVADQYRDRAGEVINDARDRARAFQEDGTAYVRENPTKALLSAAAVGFVLGLLFRR
jgi:ElaB/YqjD/DUF883 family membrane-anchored ribosome-binding protein